MTGYTLQSKCWVQLHKLLKKLLSSQVEGLWSASVAKKSRAQQKQLTWEDGKLLSFLILTDKLLSFVNLPSYTAACKIGSGAPNGDESVWSEQDGFSVFVRCSCDWIVGWGLTEAQCNVYKTKSSNFLYNSWGHVSETLIRHIFCYFTPTGISIPFHLE